GLYDVQLTVAADRRAGFDGGDLVAARANGRWAVGLARCRTGRACGNAEVSKGQAAGGGYGAAAEVLVSLRMRQPARWTCCPVVSPGLLDANGANLCECDRA